MDPKPPLILYVDDDHANRVVFTHTFGKSFRLICADSGESALAAMSKEPVAVLVTDQRMPGMTGDELLARVKVLSPDTVRIVVTAYSDLDPILKAVNDGLVVRYIIKPWDRAELEQTLRWALEVYELGRTNSAIQLRLIQTERVLTLGQVAAAVIHDLRQPLSNIILHAERLLEHAAAAPLLERLATASAPQPRERRDLERLQDLATELPELAEELCDAAKFMSDVLKQLTQFQQTRVGTPTDANVDPAALVRLALSMCRGDAMMSGCSLVNDVAEHLPRVRASTSQLLQILINVVRNALQAVEATQRAGTVVVQAIDQSDHVRFIVRDDGSGMSREALAKMGTPFFTTRPEGTGIGVSQVRRLVGSVGGKLTIESAEGKGTTVIFTVPTAVNRAAG
jgi:signal transduction histidine kinase